METHQCFILGSIYRVHFLPFPSISSNIWPLGDDLGPCLLPHWEEVTGLYLLIASNLQHTTIGKLVPFLFSFLLHLISRLSNLVAFSFFSHPNILFIPLFIYYPPQWSELPRPRSPSQSLLVSSEISQPCLLLTPITAHISSI